MPIISKVGRRSWRVRLLFAGIYSLLIVGSLTMVYPFAIMIAGSFKSQVDVFDYGEIVPRYFFDDVMLYRKHVEQRYNESVRDLNARYRTHYGRFEDVDPPAACSVALLSDWREFLESDRWHAQFPEDGRIPTSFFIVGSYIAPSFNRPQLYQMWIQRLRDTFDNDVNAMNRTWGTTYDAFAKAWPIVELWHSRRYMPRAGGGLYADFERFKNELREEQPRFLLPICGDGLFLEEFVYPNYGREIQRYNRTHGTRYGSYQSVHLSEYAPPSPRTRDEWDAYVSDPWRRRNVRLRGTAKEAFRSFLLERYGSFREFAEAYGYRRQSIAAFEIAEAVTLDAAPVVEDLGAFLEEYGEWEDVYLQTSADWEQFVRSELHIQFLRMTPAGVAAFKAYLLDIYSSSSEADDAGEPLEAFGQRYGDVETARYTDLASLLADLEIRQPLPLFEQTAVDFETFVSTRCPLSELRLVTLDVLWAEFLRQKYGTPDALNRTVADTLTYPTGSREEILGRLSPLGHTALEVMKENGIETMADLFRAVQDDIENGPHEKDEASGLLSRFGMPTLDHLKLALDTPQRSLVMRILEIDGVLDRRVEDFREVPPQEHARDWDDLMREGSAIRREFMVSNYRIVLEFMLLHGRALFNTAVLVLGMIGCALSVNPLAAYALSRFQLPSTYKIMLFFMATMAFPSEVTMIPNFLLLKNFPIGYLLQGVILLGLFFGGKHLIGRGRPGVWRVIEGAMVVASIALVGAAILGRTTTVEGAGLYAVAAILAASLIAMLLATPRSPIAHRMVTANVVARIGLVVLLTVFVTPGVARLMGFISPKVSLLNTFFALILPVMANGYSIFLLKGFFDSLPRNLYESAQMEGASEMWMFFRVTLPLSKPILAVIALQTFNIAYMTFMYAFIVCQEERMWTIMVFLYELQIESPQFVVFASIVIASMPTLVVFVLAQRVIMRGIIIPVEK